jgi:hypothetical protein
MFLNYLGSGKRTIGRPKKRWRDVYDDDDVEF